MVAIGAVLTILAGLGTVRILADPTVHWAWVATGALVSVAGVWAGVPEVGPAVVVGGVIAGLAVITALTRASWTRSAGLGLAAAIGWAALSGAAGRPWATVGGALCTGIAPWVAVLPRVRKLPSRRRAAPSFLAAHVILVSLAARWIGIVPHAGWLRVAAVAVAGLAVATTTRPRA
jgi:hypothetical protein